MQKPGTRIVEPKKPRPGRPFCVKVNTKDPVCKFVFDVGNVEQQQRWLTELRAAAGTSDTQAYLHRLYTFTISADDEELARFTIRYRSASAVHEKLHAAGVVTGLTFPGEFGDTLRDFIHDEANWGQRAQQLTAYYQELLRRHDAISHEAFKANFNFDFAELAERHRRRHRRSKVEPEPEPDKNKIVEPTIFAKLWSKIVEPEPEPE